MSDDLVKDIQSAVETAYAELLKTKPDAKLDRSMLYKDSYILKVNSSIEALIEVGAPHLKGADLVKMWANNAYSMGDMKGANNRAFRIVSAWNNKVVHGPKIPFDESGYLQMIKSGSVRPATKVEPSKSEPEPKVPKSEPVPEPETQPDPPADVGEGVQGAIFDSDTLMEFYEDEPEVVIQTVPAKPEPEPEPESEPESYDYRALAERIKETGNVSKYLPVATHLLMQGHNVILEGDAGLGKTYLAECVAKVLQTDLHIVPSPQMASDVLGFANALGEYSSVAFTRGYENGGIILMDEPDRGVQEAIIVANSALANGYMDIPTKGTVYKNVNTRIICAMNTNGMGATEEYNTAVKMDASFLSRFFVLRVEWEHDVAMKLAHDDAEIVEFIEDFRQSRATFENMKGAILGYREVINLSKISTDPVAMPSLVSMMGALEKCTIGIDDLKKVLGRMEHTSNRYCKMLRAYANGYNDTNAYIASIESFADDIIRWFNDGE